MATLAPTIGAAGEVRPASTAAEPHPSQHQQLTSFGFLDETAEEEESVFGISNLFTRVRNALAPAGDAAPHDARTNGLTSTASHEGSFLQGSTSAGPARPFTAPSSTVLLAGNGQDRKTSGKGPDEASLRQNTDGGSGSMPQIKAGPSRKSSRASSTHKSFAPSIKGSGLMPYSVSSSSFAPAVTSTAAAHAIAPQRLQSFTPDTMKYNDDNEDGEDVLSALMRKSGVDQSRRKNAGGGGGGGGFSSIPGFPLSKDTLADDARSIHSTSSRRPRSETHSTSEAHFVVAHAHAHGPTVRTDEATAQASTGLGASADAFRRMRGEGTVLSRDLWMPDDNVKECRECQSYFTPFRRKHHCRICGLVYCSRCASNIVSGRRFGLDRADIRICNYCLRVMSEYERAGRRSSHETLGAQSAGGQGIPGSPSSMSSPHRVATTYARKRTESNGLGVRPDKAMISAPLEAQLQSPQSQFAANQLFSHPRGAVGSSLHIAQGVPRLDSLQDMLLELEEDTRSRSQTPTADLFSSGKSDREESTDSKHGAVPFRVKMSEEDRMPATEDDMPRLASADDKDAAHTKAVEMAAAKKSKATSAAEDAGPTKTIRLRGDTNRSKLLSDSLVARERGVSEAALRAMRKSKLRAREQQLHGDEDGAAGGGLRSALLPKAAISRKSSYSSTLTSRTDELDTASVRHFSALLQQALQRQGILHADKWQKVLEPLLLRVVRHIHPRPRLGESMDVRQYIKFKRIPGGSIAESAYVDGFVLSKQVATKKMARSLPLSNPRVMVVAFPIDFHAADDEHQFMSLQPVLAQEHEYTRILVARLLQLRPNVLVVKGSVSRLALDMLDEAGVVVVWSIKMSAVQAISRCCQADIIASVERLALEPRLGRCASFSVETFQHAASPQCRKSLMRFQTSGHARSFGCSLILRGATLDNLGTIKSVAALMVYAAHNLRLEGQLNRDEGAQLTLTRTPLERMGSVGLCAGGVDGKDDELWQRILAALKPYQTSILSASASVEIPPPYQLVKMKETHRRLVCLQQDCSCEVLTSATTTPVSQTIGLPSKSESGSVAEDRQAVVIDGGEEKQGQIVTLEEVMPKPSQLQADYAKALVDHQLFLKEWNDCVAPDTASSLRKISVLWTLISTATHKPCLGPRLLTYTFYGPQDETLGQFLERTCAENSTLCSAKGCGRPLGVHHASFVHNDTRVQVVLERFVCPIPGQEARLLMWSYCKRCERATPVTPVSDDTWSLSFAKYLELHFYDGHKTTTLCEHDYYADFVRFFSLQNLAIRFHRDRDLVVRDVVLPPMMLLPRPDVDYRLKVDSAKNLQERMNAYWSSVLERMSALRKEPTLSVQHVGQLEGAIKTAKADEAQLKALLVDTCRASEQTDVLALNAVRNRLQSYVVRWDQFFQEFERAALPSERDVRRLTSHHLSRIFHEKGTSVDSSTSERVVEALGLSPAVEVDESQAMATIDAALSASMANEEGKDSLPSQPDAIDPLHMTLSQPSSPTLSSPAAWRRLRASTQSQMPDHSAAEASLPSSKSEGPDLVSSSSGVSDTDALSARPPLRRGRTSGEVRVLRKNADGGESERTSSVEASRAPRHPSGGSAAVSPHATRRNAGIPRRGPPSSYRPPKSLLNAGAMSSGMDTESDGSSVGGGGGGGGNNRRKLSVSQRRGRIQALDAAVKESSGSGSSGVVDSLPAHARELARPGSRVPVPLATRSSRVTTIARRFDNLHREAERERERQRLVRARRARPVGASQATVQVYRSLKEAVRDDDEDDDGVDDGRSVKSGLGSEAEDEEDSDGERMRKDRRRAKRQSEEQQRTIRPHHARAPASQATIKAGKCAVKMEEEEAETTGSGEATPLVVPSGGECAAIPTAELLSEHDGSPEHGFAPSTSSTSEASQTTQTASSVGASGHSSTDTSAAGLEVTVSSLLSGTLPASWRASLLPLIDSETSSDGRGSLLKTLTSLWGRGTLHLPMIELPVRSTEHLFSDSPLVVLREDEPSSLIAFTLNSSTYAARLESLRRAQAPPTQEATVTASSSSVNGEQSNDSWRLIEPPSPTHVELGSKDSIESALRQTEGTHLSFQFTSGDSRFSIRVLFTEQFDALRQACACGQTFVQSLSRCWNWSNCSGGKSGAAMMKTLDDRFIIKQLSRAEMDAFASNAGAYFRFLADVLYHDRPTTLAKIYGVYRLTIRNAQTGKSIKLDCAITENVFANAEMTQIFDLKGALRNRYVQPNGQANQVLLDGNLITSKVPIYLREGSKRILRRALYYDSLFLASCDVMDYSLVVGVCEGTAEVRVGIIDFIRTFTFGKKAESFLKEAVGGHGSEAPTIVDPKQYRARFLAFLDSVLLLSPDHWLSEEQERVRSAEMQSMHAVFSGGGVGGIAIANSAATGGGGGATSQNSMAAALVSATPGIVML